MKINKTLEKWFGVKIIRVRPQIKSINIDSGQIKSIIDLLQPHDILNFSLLRVGNLHDGGYVCVNDFHQLECAFSFGIEEDVSWDLELAERGISVYQYDYTVSAPPINHRNFHFNKIKISPHASSNTESIDSLIGKKGIINDNSTILKIDIEGSEWSTLCSTTESSYKKIRQIICEFHNFDQLEDDRYRNDVIRTLQKLKSYYEVVHIHANNYSPILRLSDKSLFPQTLEVTLAAKTYYEFGSDIYDFPTKLDNPNNPFCEDFKLDFLK